MGIDYTHSENLHTLSGPQAALPILFANGKPSSLLDVGCGTGTWLKAAADAGISEIMGVDGVDIPAEKLLIPSARFRQQDLTEQWDLGRRFAATLCLEVAEHLDRCHAGVLVDALTRHSERVVFSAACPGQDGQHHVNGQWPAYWQNLFNERGFVCCDKLRWRIWDDGRIEPWYRQNIFVARHEATAAGHEPRIKAVVHPEMLPFISTVNGRFENHVRQIERGHMRATWYLKTPVLAFAEKFKRRLA